MSRLVFEAVLRRFIPYHRLAQMGLGEDQTPIADTLIITKI